jgi:enamine deaminase RidA (YjgF/YER057c/UK114 family)
MSETVEDRLRTLGIVLPAPPQAVANYVPSLIVDDLLYVAGQLPLLNGALTVTGKLGAEVTLDEGVAAARQCAINILTQAKAVAGSLNDIRRVVSLRVYVASTPHFTQHPKVANGASDLMVELFGERGRHVRAAVGVTVLPMDAPVEIEAVFAV